MKPAKKELIEEVAELFLAYEEEYVPGEWEAFVQAGKKRSRIFPVWIRVAAIMAMIISVLPHNLNDLIQSNKDTEFGAALKVVSAKPDVGVLVPSVYSGHLAIRSSTLSSPASHLTIKDSSRQTVVEPGNHHAAEEIYTSVVPSVVRHEENANIGSTGDVASAIVLSDTAVSAKKQKTIDFFLSEAKASQLASTSGRKGKSSKWGFGIEIMPTVMKSSLNVGAGITTDYRLSDKFSISSGISLLQLEAGTDVSSNTNSSVSSLSAKELTATDANLSAIDIPVGLTYHVNKNFYASAGVSYFNVISEKRSNTYTKTAEFYRSDVDALTGNTALYQAVKSESVAEDLPESPLKGNSYLGFFNFSIGRQQQLFSRYSIIIEPFVKIPVGKLSDQELKLMNSGVKFKLAF